MKTYLFPEVAGHGEITEWVPADVARELFGAISNLVNFKSDYPCEISNEELAVWAKANSAIKKACGES